MNELQGKVALVTGGASGIGRATVERFIEEGANVVIADVQDGPGNELAAANPGRAVYVHADVSQEADIAAMVRAAVESFGRLDVLFNNAGIDGDQAPTADATLANWNRVIAINLTGVFLGMKYGIPAMLKGGGGSIINTASVAGLVGFAGIPAYCAAKGGVVQLTRAAALEYATQGIRVNAICPGVIATPMVEHFVGTNEAARANMVAMEPVGRLGKPGEVADLAVYLASDRSAFVTGTAIPIDGGLVAR